MVHADPPGEAGPGQRRSGRRAETDQGTAARGPGNGLGHGLLRHLDPRTAPALAELPGPRVSFNYLGRLSVGRGAGEPWSLVGGLGGGADADMPVPHVLSVNAFVLDGPDGPTLRATFSWPGDILGEDEVRDLARAWTRSLTELAHAVPEGGRTPSDVPLVKVTQQDIEDLEALEPGLEDILPLAPLQDGLLFHALFDEDARDVYTVQIVFDFADPVDADRLRVAGDALLRRHANLRTAFRRTPSGESVQCVLPPGRVGFPVREADPDDYDRLLAQDRAARFDLAAPPLVRALVCGTRMVLTNHHILLDGWSMPILAQELFALYESDGDDRALPPVTAYADYLSWLARQDPAAAHDAWRAALDGFEEPTLVAAAGATRTAAVPERLVLTLPPGGRPPSSNAPGPAASRSTRSSRACGRCCCLWPPAATTWSSAPRCPGARRRSAASRA